MKKFFNTIILLLIIFNQSSCVLFSDPEGTAEIISSYTIDSGNYHYLENVVKITNIGNKNIYSSTISLQADSSKRTYYETTTSNIVIKPGYEIYITVELSFEEKDDEEKEKPSEDEKEKWKEETVKIIDVFWN